MAFDNGVARSGLWRTLRLPTDTGKGPVWRQSARIMGSRSASDADARAGRFRPTGSQLSRQNMGDTRVCLLRCRFPLGRYYTTTLC